MKLNLVVLALASAVFAAPRPGSGVSKRENAEPATDKLLFDATLPEFIARRNKRDPSTLDWSSDGCTSSPDNPFRFPFLPACQRHDFGYRNYKNQKRFTSDNRAKIDLKFKNECVAPFPPTAVPIQVGPNITTCNQVSASTACKALAEVYYAAVRMFGGFSHKKREEQAELERAYQDAVVTYNEAVKEAQEEGLLPVLDY